MSKILAVALRIWCILGCKNILIQKIKPQMKEIIKHSLMCAVDGV